MDTVIRAVRVALLILVTGTFAALWSGDHPDRMADIDRSPKVLVGHRQPVRQQRIRNIRHLLEQLPPPSPSSGNSSGSPIPLPQGITAGQYLVVDQFGHTQQRVVAASELATGSPATTAAPVDHYSVSNGNARWHYIRVERRPGDQWALQIGGKVVR